MPRPEYTTEVGDAGEKYLDEFVRPNTLPATFRWEVLFTRMLDAAEKAEAAKAPPKLTERQQKAYNVLALIRDDGWCSPQYVAHRAGFATTYPAETASRYLDQLVKLGLAEKGGTRMFPQWRVAR